MGDYNSGYDMSEWGAGPSDSEILDIIDYYYLSKWENDQCSEETYDYILDRVGQLKAMIRNFPFLVQEKRRLEGEE